MFAIRTELPEPRGPQGTAARMIKLPADWQVIVAYYEANAPGIPSGSRELACPG